jgi:hypothetical protein
MATTFGLPKLVSELFPADRTGSSTAVYQVGSQLGPVAAFGLSRPLLEPALGGWEAVFLASGAVVLGFSAVWWLATSVYARTAKEGWGDAPSDGADDESTLELGKRNIGQRRPGTGRHSTLQFGDRNSGHSGTSLAVSPMARSVRLAWADGGGPTRSRRGTSSRALKSRCPGHRTGAAAGVAPASRRRTLRTSSVGGWTHRPAPRSRDLMAAALPAVRHLSTVTGTRTPGAPWIPHPRVRCTDRAPSQLPRHFF